MEDFKHYTQDKIKEEENKIDKYYINIGENAHIKNYIGFQSLEDSETFMNFNYKNLYKKIFPSKNVITVSIIFLVLLLIFLFFQIVIALKFFDKIESNEKNDSKTSNEETEVAINNEVKDEIDQQKLNDT